MEMILYCEAVYNTLQLVELSKLRNNMELEEVVKESEFSDCFFDVGISSPLTLPCDSSPSSDDDDSESSPSSDDDNSASECETVKIVDQLEKELKNYLRIRKQTINELQSLKRDLEESYHKSRKAIVGGAVGAVTGTALGILGFGLVFVTFGASLSLMVTGGAMGAAGVVTVVGAKIGYTVVSKMRMEKVEEVCQNDEKQKWNVRDLIMHFRKYMEKLRTCYPHNTEEQLLELILKRRRCFSNDVIDIGPAAVHVSDVARRRSLIAIESFRQALGLAGEIVGVVAVALDDILLPFDICLPLRTSIAAHNDRVGRREFNSNLTCEVGNILKALEKRTKLMTIMQDLLKTIE